MKKVLVLELSSLFSSFKLLSIVSKDMDLAFLPYHPTRVCQNVLAYMLIVAVYACMSQCNVLCTSFPKDVQMTLHWLSYS